MAKFSVFTPFVNPNASPQNSGNKKLTTHLISSNTSGLSFSLSFIRSYMVRMILVVVVVGNGGGVDDDGDNNDGGDGGHDSEYGRDLHEEEDGDEYE